MDEDTKTYLEYGRTGHPGLFRKLYDKYKVMLLTTVRHIAGVSRTEAEDLLQEVFMKVIEQRNRFQTKARFSTWLYKIAINRAYNAVRDRKQTVAVDEALVDNGQELPLTRLLKDEQAEMVRSALGGLNERQRTALVLKEYENKSYTEISDIMAVSESAVESLLFHARDRLRTLLRRKLS